MKLPKVLVILGPTATGKSDMAVFLAQTFKGEVISADSRQVYRDLDIGAGKITQREMKGVPHHLLDIADPKRARYTVDDFRRDGTKAITSISKRGHLPIVCGGTGFYIDALIFNEIFPDVPPNQKLRTQLEKKSTDTLMKEIMKLDPRRAKALDPKNKIRIIRAIEIARALGSVPKVKHQKKYDVLWIGLNLPHEELRERIHIRLMKRMKGNKLVNEVANLHTQGVSWKRLHAFGLEYRYVALFLQKKITKEEMLVQLENEIVHFSKRQITWWKKNKNITWFSPRDVSQIQKKVKNFL